MTTPTTPAADAPNDLQLMVALYQQIKEGTARESALVAERNQLHAIVCQCLAALGNGSGATTECSIEFLQGAPHEIELHVAVLIAERDQLRAALLQAARDVEDLKQPCHMDDPESRQAARNSLYMSIAAKARGVLADLAAPAVEGK